MARYERYVYLIIELLALALALVLASYFTDGDLDIFHSPLFRLLLGCTALIWVIVSLLGAFRPMDRRLSGGAVVQDLVASLVTALFGTLAVSYMVDIQGLPANLIGWQFLFFSLLVGFTRIAIWSGIRAYRAAGYNFKRIVIVGSNPVSKRFMDEMGEHPEYGYKLMARFGLDTDEPRPGQLPLSEFDHYVVSHRIDQVYIAEERINRKVLAIVRFCTLKDIRVVFINNLIDQLHRSGFRAYLDDGGMTALVAIDPRKYRNILGRSLKRLFDLVFSLVVIVLVMPWLYPIAALLIKLSSPGPVLFIQQRTGLVNRPFGCMKFRTMRMNVDSDKRQAVKGDPRITRIGQFLRKSNLDEMPQFFNVFLGHMSVVGPRPHMLSHTEEYNKLIGPYMERLWLKPGITGLAQAKGLRGETHELFLMEKRVEADRYYILNWSFALDVYVILLTIWNMVTLKKQGA
ncbi:MAG: exopolysaccharide biosynthesis polyprenyl glycosylphosphotransferase [Flavobacteriales bacterium]|nr:exopolysaccharide biosynthesis polyprenyl glycosylphosphotransferase [Flavobacteriales bacterium]